MLPRYKMSGNQDKEKVESKTVQMEYVWPIYEKIQETRLGCFYVTAILSWGYGWGWFEVELNLRLKWGWYEIESKFSWTWVRVELSWSWDKLTLNKGRNWPYGSKYVLGLLM